MRISDWSSDVCSSDLQPGAALPRRHIGFGDRVARLRQPDSVVGDDDADDIAGAYIELRVDRARTVMIGFFRLFFDSLDGILDNVRQRLRSEEHTSELQSQQRISYADFCLKKKT